MSMMKQIYIAMHEDGLEMDNAVARISLKAFQLYSDFEDGKIANFAERFNALCADIKETNSSWDGVKEWLVAWKEAIESNHNYLIVDNLDNCVQAAYDLGLEDESHALHESLIEIEVNLDELVTQ